MRNRSAARTAAQVGQVEEWFDLYVDSIQQYAARRVGADVAQDVVAETFRAVLEQLDEFDADRGSARAWLFGIATNQIRRHWRTEQRRLRSYADHARRSVTAIDPVLESDGRIDARRRLAELADAVSTLDPADRDVLVLVAWEDLSSTEVAAVLGIPAGTVRSRLNRVRMRLRGAADEIAALQEEVDHG